MNELTDILKYYKTTIMPYKYIITSDNHLQLEFKIEPDNLCHLIFGTIEKNVPNGNMYKGIKGYNNIENGVVTRNNIPHSIHKHSGGRIDFFNQIHKLIDKPSGGFFFNPHLVLKGKHIRINPTEIRSDFLIYKKTEDSILHLFFKNTLQSGQMVLVPNCFFIRSLSGFEPTLFIDKQKDFRILASKKEIRSS